MKMWKLLSLGFIVMLLAAPSSKGEEPLKTTTLAYDRDMTMLCSQIIKKGYLGNLSEGAHTAYFEISDGSKFYKVFTAPQPLQQAATFVSDLGLCKQISFNYEKNSYRAYYISSFNIEF